MAWLILFPAGLLIGGAAGALFFGGLWLTTQRLSTTSRPALLLSVSMLGRMAGISLLLVGLARAHPALLIGALAGFVAARMVLTHRASIDRLPPPATSTGPAAGV